MCDSIEPRYAEVCAETANARVCKMCQGISGWPREREQQYLDRLLRKQTPSEGEAGPGMLRKLWNFAKAAVQHAATGFQRVSDEVLAERQKTCDGCDRRDGDNCQACGCILSIKATWRSETCPLGRWPAVEPRVSREPCGGCGGAKK